MKKPVFFTFLILSLCFLCLIAACLYREVLFTINGIYIAGSDDQILVLGDPYQVTDYDTKIVFSSPMIDPYVARTGDLLTAEVSAMTICNSTADLHCGDRVQIKYVFHRLPQTIYTRQVEQVVSVKKIESDPREVSDDIRVNSNEDIRDFVDHHNENLLHQWAMRDYLMLKNPKDDSYLYIISYYRSGLFYLVERDANNRFQLIKAYQFCKIITDDQGKEQLMLTNKENAEEPTENEFLFDLTTISKSHEE